MKAKDLHRKIECHKIVKTFPTYFLCPQFDYPSSSIDLGHIISSPSDPSAALNLDDIRPEINSHILIMTLTALMVGPSQLNDQTPGVLPKFLQVFVIDSDFEHDKATEDVFECDLLETGFFEPSTAYLNKAKQAEGVQMFLAGSRFQKALYIVTGMKTAKGGRSSHKTHNSRTASLNPETFAGVAGIAGIAGVPITVRLGVEVASSWMRAEVFSPIWISCLPFIWAN